jgi:hypothetical protein
MWRLTAAVLTSALLAPSSATVFQESDRLLLPATARWSTTVLIRDALQIDEVFRDFDRLRFDTKPLTSAPTPRTKKGTRTAIVLTVLGAVTFVWLYAHCFYRCK